LRGWSSRPAEIDPGWSHPTVAGLFERLKDEALAAFDRIVGLDMDNLAIDGSLLQGALRR